MSRAPLRVAVLGAGTVGTEVVRGLRELGDRLAPADGGSLVLTAIAVRNVDAARERGLPAEMLTDAPAHLIAADDTDVIVELMGGDEPARTLIAAALGAGKAVVTANKHVLAHHGPELEGIARRTGAALRFEAAVAGGIPVLSPLASDLAANRIGRVRGIVNGTTNYILTAMAQEGRAYGDVLIDAQDLGYAEADPTGDVEGHDAVNKLVILARLAFDVWLEPGSIAAAPPTARGTGRPGITGVTDQEVEGAGALGLSIKLLATAARTDAGIVASVLPTAVPADSPFGWTDGVTNRIEIDAEPLGTVRLAGPGAGAPRRAARCSATCWPWHADSPRRGRACRRPGHPPSPRSMGSMPLATGTPSCRRSGTSRCPRPSRKRLRCRSRRDCAAHGGVTLADARAAFDAILPPGADLTLYPVDD